MEEKFDFSGWATKNNLKCSDGRTIMPNAFQHNDGEVVPLVWNHEHNNPMNVLGHALLENRDEGVYAFCSFNNTPAGDHAKMLVQHGDVDALSIFANKLQQQGPNVVHGDIKEVSLVLAGANPGAYIESVMMHGEESEEEAMIFTGDKLTLRHAKTPTKEPAAEPDKKPTQDAGGDETIGDVFDTLTDKQKTVVYALVGQAIEDANNTDDTKGGTTTMKHNVFDQTEEDQKAQGDVLSHSELTAIFSDTKRYGSLRDSALAHGVTNIDYLFPDAKTMDTPPQFIQRKNSWVQQVMNGTHHTPFSRLKSVFADITGEDARALGYIKGNLKKDEVFALLKRTTTPTTIYKKQKLDRDDVVDIVDFDVVAWIKAEMRVMLDEEIARAILVGDGRLAASDDKISESNIRPVWTDDALYSIKATYDVASNATDDDKAKAFIRAAIKARKDYRGSGNTQLFCPEDVLTNCLLLEDSTGRAIYDSVAKLATTLRVSEIVPVPVMDNLTRVVDTKTHTLNGIIVDLNDYNVGADKGGAVNMFDDFDIDYNAQKYLIETRCSGALIKPYSAIVLESKVATA